FDQGSPEQGRRGLARREDAGNAELGEGREGGERVGRDVKGAMEDSFGSAGQLNESLRAITIDRSVRAKTTEGDTGSPVPQGKLGVAEQGLDLGIRVNEPAGARADHDDRRQAKGADGFDERRGRGETSHLEGRTKLEPVRPRSLRNPSVVERCDGDFEKDS